VSVANDGTGSPPEDVTSSDPDQLEEMAQAALVRPAVWLPEESALPSRSSLVAVMLSLMIPGAGHLYVRHRRVGTLLVALSLLLIGLLCWSWPLLLLPAWAILAPVSAIRAYSASKNPTGPDSGR